MRRLFSSIGLVLLLAPASLAAQQGTWAIDTSHSVVEFRVRHMMISDVRGMFAKFSGTVTGDPGDPANARIDVEIDTASINTGNERRDNHLRSDDFFDAANHPSIAFRSKRIARAGDGRHHIVGDLTMRGVTKEVVLDLEEVSRIIRDSRGNERVAARATTKINRQDFGVRWSRKLDDGGLVASDEIRITLEMQLVRQPPPPPTPSTGG
ncbi:MAG TPA: YceI family protein [Thermoanaerobaculia bacterium]|nr:YceI family protein [Thermoanaerobaculia bacterium]